MVGSMLASGVGGAAIIGHCLKGFSGVNSTSLHDHQRTIPFFTAGGTEAGRGEFGLTPGPLSFHAVYS